MADTPIIQLLLTGNEIMSGDTVDSNSAAIALHLAQFGFSIHRKVTLGDDKQLLSDEIRQMTRQSQVLIINGGLGPTIDDLTTEIMAEVTGIDLVENPKALNHLTQWCKHKGADLNAANLKQALLPKDCEIIDNPIGSAVGFYQTVNECLVMCTPGVPSELRSMMGQITSKISDSLQRAASVNIMRLQCLGMGESTVQQIISDQYPDWPEEVELGFRAGSPQLEIKLTTRKAQHISLQAQCKEKLYDLFGDHIIGEGDKRIAETVIELLNREGKTLTTAESCTGGVIASMLTEIPGSSICYHAGFIAYTDDIKSSLLNVQSKTLSDHGAVSEATVREMALGAIEKSGADYTIAVSGIAGPGGGSDDKPVGTVWIAWGTDQSIKTQCLRYNTTRKLFQTMVAAMGLDLIRRELIDIPSIPRYFEDKSC